MNNSRLVIAAISRFTPAKERQHPAGVDLPTPACFPYVTVQDGVGKDKMGKKKMRFWVRWGVEVLRISPDTRVMGLNTRRLRLEGIFKLIFKHRDERLLHLSVL